MSQVQKPVINVKDIADPVLRRNFQNLVDYFTLQDQLFGFQFFEVIFTAAEANKKIRHTLGLTPKDILLTQLTGAGSVSFNLGLFDSDTMDLTATGICRVRFFAGTKRLDGSSQEVAAQTTDTQTYTVTG